MKRVIEVVAVGALSLALVACSSSGSNGKDDKKAPAKTTTTVKKAGDKVTQPPVTGQIDRAVVKGTGIIKTTKMTSCDTKPGAVKAVGTVELPKGMDPSKVVISVAWVNSSNGNVFSRTQVTLENVSAGEKTDWEASNVLPDNGVTVRCVLGAVVPD